jgi:replicative DNA helicase
MMDNKELVEVTRKAEAALAGAILKRGSNFAAAAEIVKKDDFRTETLRWLWEAFESLQEQGLKIDLITATAELQKAGRLKDFSEGTWSGVALLSKLTDNADPRHFMTYAEQVASYSANRRILDLMHKAAEQQFQGRHAKDVAADLNTELSKIIIYSNTEEYTTHVSTSLSEAYDASTRAASGEVLGVKTGFTDLDAMLGSLMPGNMYIAAARPGRGKTALLINIALYAASQGKKVAIFSLEMSRVQLAQRMLAQTALVDLHKIVTGQMEAEEWSKVNNAVELLEKYNIHINDLSSINVSQIRSTSRKLAAGGGLDLILVDYIQLAQVDDPKKAYSREQEVSSISRGLKWLARELEVPILAAAQLSRAIEQRGNGRPVLSDLRESGTLEQDAFGVLFIHQNPEELADRQNVRELILEKNRNGATGSCEVLWDAPHVRFLNGTTRVEWTAPDA